MKNLTIKDLAIKFDIPETTLRGWVSRDELTTSAEIIKNRKTRVVLLDEKAAKKISEYRGVVTSVDEINNLVTSKNEPRYEHVTSSEIHDDKVQEAEIINDSEQYNLVSIEQSSFDNLINNIKSLADARAESDNETIKRYKEEYLELKTKNTQLEEENKQLIRDLALAEAEVRIKDMRIVELEERKKEVDTRLQSGKESNVWWSFINNPRRL